MWYSLENTEGCESLPSSPAPAAEYSEARCSDGALSVPSKSRSTRETSSCNGSETGSSTPSRSGMTSAHSTESRGVEMSMSSAEVSHVRTSARPDEDSALSAASGAGCGESTHVSFARYDRATASWKTAQCLLLGGLESFLGTWPRSGMMRRGRCYPLAIAAHRTNGRECGSSEKMATPCSHDSFDIYLKDSSTSRFDSARLGLATYVKKWPTPQSRDFKSGMASRVERSWQNLNGWVAKWPTPCATEARQGLQIRRPGKKGSQISLTTAVVLSRNSFQTPCLPGKGGTNGKKKMIQVYGNSGGKLNPDWVEWLMQWPIGWTALKPLATDRFRLWQQGRFAN